MSRPERLALNLPRIPELPLSHRYTGAPIHVWGIETYPIPGYIVQLPDEWYADVATATHGDLTIELDRLTPYGSVPILRFTIVKDETMYWPLWRVYGNRPDADDDMCWATADTHAEAIQYAGEFLARHEAAQ